MSMFKELFQIFQEKGSKRDLHTNDLVPLSQKGSIFAFENGEIRIFAENEERFYLGYLTEGILFTSEKKESSSIHEICAIANAKIELFEMKEEELEKELEKSAQRKALFAKALDQWIELLPHNLAPTEVPNCKYSIFPDQTLELLKNETFSIKKQKEWVAWIHPLQGSLALYGNDQFLLDNQEHFFPMSSSFWFEAKAESKVETLSSINLVEKKLWRKALPFFHSLFCLYIPLYLKQKKHLEEKLLQSRKTEEDRDFTLALEQMESVLTSKMHVKRQKARTALEEALFMIAQDLEISLTFPTTDKTEDLHKSIQSIAEASLIRVRRVSLDSLWWEKNHGPLLGFLGEKKKPVALIRKNSSYKIETPTFKKKVGASVAKEISEKAYMLYPPLPKEITSVKQLLFFSYKKFRKGLLSVCLYGLIATLISFFPPIAAGFLFSNAIPEYSYSLVAYLTLGLIFSSFGYALFYFFRDFSFLSIGGLSSHLIQTAVWDRILKLSPSFFRKYTVGNLFWRVMSVDEIQTLFGGGAFSQLLNGLFAFVFAIIMFVYAPLLAWIALLLSVFCIALSLISSLSLAKIYQKALEAQGDAKGLLIQIIGGILKLRVCRSEKNAFSQWALLCAESNFFLKKAKAIQNIVNVSSVSFPVLSYFCFYFAFLVWIDPDQIALSDFLAFNVAFGSFSLAIYPLCLTLSDLAKASSLWKRMQPIFQEPLEETEAKVDPQKLSGSISLNHVFFGYDLERPPILKDISFSVSPQEFIGIVGKSGSGKSTLIRLLLGFEKPLAGSVYYDGKDLSKLNVKNVRSQLGVVLQKNSLMAGSIYENIVCGGLYGEEEILRVLELSGVAEILEDLPMGLNTFVQMNGVNFTGGQQQRILLARALLGSPPILIFDEATSSLDSVTQKKICNHLDTLNVTRIVIAQRLSTIQKADRIYVLEEGRISQQGTFEELSLQEGLFQKMWTRQTL